MREALDQLGSHWIANHEENDGNGRCCGFGTSRGNDADADQEIDVRCDKLGCHALESVGQIVGISMLELDVAPFHIAELAEPLDQGRKDRTFLLGIGSSPEHAYS